MFAQQQGKNLLPCQKNWGVSEAGLAFCRAVSQLAARAHHPEAGVRGIAMQEPNSSAIPYNFTVSAHAFCNMSTCSIAPTEVSYLAGARSHTTAICACTGGQEGCHYCSQGPGVPYEVSKKIAVRAATDILQSLPTASLVPSPSLSPSYGGGFYAVQR